MLQASPTQAQKDQRYCEWKRQEQKSCCWTAIGSGCEWLWVWRAGPLWSSLTNITSSKVNVNQCAMFSVCMIMPRYTNCHNALQSSLSRLQLLCFTIITSTQVETPWGKSLHGAPLVSWHSHGACCALHQLRPWSPSSAFSPAASMRCRYQRRKLLDGWSYRSQ